MEAITFIDWLEINQLLCRYVDTLESDDWIGLGECFAPDVAIDLSEILGDAGPPGRGRDVAVGQIRARREQAPAQPSRHLLSNTIIREAAPGRVRCQTSLTLVVTPIGGEPRVGLTGQYHDVLVKGSDRQWRIAERKLYKDVAPVVRAPK